jgi:hypothetical protein
MVRLRNIVAHEADDIRLPVSEQFERSLGQPGGGMGKTDHEN